MGLTRIVISGGMGFISQHLARALLARGYKITLVDDFHREQTMPNDLGQSCEILKCDIRDTIRLDGDILIHAAAIAGVQTVVTQPKHVLDVNIGGTGTALQSFTGNRQVLFFSTSEVYGPRCFKAKESDMLSLGPLDEPRWVYAASKIAGEHLVAGYCRERGIPYTIIRPFNVYGPGQLGDGAVRNFIAQAKAGQPLVVHGDGTQLRAWCYISDCVAAVVATVENPMAYNQVFNVGNPAATCTTRQLAEKISELAPWPQTPIEHREIAYPEIDVRVPDISKAQAALSWEPKVPLDFGLKGTIEAMR